MSFTFLQNIIERMRGMNFARFIRNRHGKNADLVVIRQGHRCGAFRQIERVAKQVAVVIGFIAPCAVW